MYLVPRQDVYDDLVFPVTVPPTGRTNAVLAISIILWCIAVVMLCLRLYTRHFVVQALGWDDVAMGVAVAIYGVFCGCTGALAFMLVNTPGSINENTLTLVTNLLQVIEIFYCITVAAVKVALGLFFLRIVVVRWQKWFIYSVMSITVIYSLGYAGWAIFQCGVPGQGAAFWQKKIAGQCDTPQISLAVGYTHAILNAITDIAMSILPIPIIHKSQLAAREKRIIYCILFLAAAGSIASIVRIRWIYVLAISDLSFWFQVQTFAIFSVLEPGLGIIAGCLATYRPLLRPLVKTIRHNLGSTLLSSTERSGSSSEPSTQQSRKLYKTRNSLRVSKAFLFSRGNDEERPVADSSVASTLKSKKNRFSQHQSQTDEPLLEKPAPVYYNPEPQPIERQSINTETKERIRSKRATWFLMPRDSITSIGDSTLTSTTDKQDDTWLELK